MHDGVHFLRGKIDVLAAFIGQQEAVAIAMTLNRPLDFAQQRAAVLRGSYCVLEIFDARISFFPEIDTACRLASRKAQVAELVDALVSGTSG